MHFQNPNFIYALILIPVFILLFIYGNLARKKQLKKIIGLTLINKLTREISYTKRNVKHCLLILAIAIFVFTLMRPQWGNKLIKVTRKGIDLIFVIDVSKSMLAEDILPNRLEKAKIQLTSFMDKLKGDRVGLVVFAGSSFVACPLTLDYNALKLFIDLLSPEMVNHQGTLLAKAIKTARECFDIKQKKYKAIVLLTDGEDHGEGPLEEAKLCRKEGIRIYTIGLGKREGEPIPIRDENNQITGYLKDKNNQIVMSRLDEKTLQNMAFETKGKYIFSQYGELELDKIYKDIQTLDKKNLGSKKLRQKEDRFQYFVGLLLFILVFEMLMTERKKSKKKHLLGRYE